MSYVVEWQLKSADDFVDKVNLEVKVLNTSFFKIGCYLYEAQKRYFYQRLGYDSIISCSEALFGFKKTLTYDLINIYRRFKHGDDDYISFEYSHLNQSQLVALLPCQAGVGTLAQIIKPSDSVENVKRAVKVFNGLSLSTRAVFKCDNLADFLNEFDYPGSSSVDRSGSSAQAEKSKKQSSPDLPLYDQWSDFCDCEAIKSNLEAAIDHMSKCFNECNVGSSFRNEVIQAHNNLKGLLDKFIH